jgi:hypothetical protein
MKEVDYYKSEKQDLGQQLEQVSTISSKSVCTSSQNSVARPKILWLMVVLTPSRLWFETLKYCMSPPPKLRLDASADSGDIDSQVVNISNTYSISITTTVITDNLD